MRISPDVNTALNFIGVVFVLAALQQGLYIAVDWFWRSFRKPRTRSAFA